MDKHLYNRYTILYQRRQWHPTPVLLLGKSHGQRSLVGCSPWGREESYMTAWLHVHFSLSCIGEGNGNPLQCSCLENPRDGEPGGLPSKGSHRVGHDWSDLAAAQFYTDARYTVVNATACSVSLGNLERQILIEWTGDFPEEGRYKMGLERWTWAQWVNMKRRGFQEEETTCRKA